MCLFFPVANLCPSLTIGLGRSLLQGSPLHPGDRSRAISWGQQGCRCQVLRGKQSAPGMAREGRQFPKLAGAGAVARLPAGPGPSVADTATAKPAQQGQLWGNQHPHFSLPSSHLLLCLHWLNPTGSRGPRMEGCVSEGSAAGCRKGEKAGEGPWRSLSTLGFLFLEWVRRGPAGSRVAGLFLLSLFSHL